MLMSKDPSRALFQGRYLPDFCVSEVLVWPEVNAPGSGKAEVIDVISYFARKAQKYRVLFNVVFWSPPMLFTHGELVTVAFKYCELISNDRYNCLKVLIAICSCSLTAQARLGTTSHTLWRIASWTN